ncbi:MAG: 30S ribosomal protein S2 [candidate division WOR-3 bacterium]
MDQAIDLKAMLEAGLHFGHRSRRWNPKMKPYIFGRKNGIYIIDLEKTVERMRIAYDAVRNIAEAGQDLLFVGTKQQARPIIQEEAARCGAFSVTERWIGGLLTNFEIVSKRITRMAELERMIADNDFGDATKKEALLLQREYRKLAKMFSGVKDMDRLPGAVFIVDPVREETALAECRRMKVPVVALIDTNGDPELIDYPIPGNDDALRSIRLVASMIANAFMEGRKEHEPERTESSPSSPTAEGQ